MEFLMKHKRNQKTNKKLAEKGITLIALVITVIVLLILAGVSISAITGNESAMEKAKQAKTANENADELDTIKLAIVEAVAAGYTGEIDGDVLAEKLTGIATVEPQQTGGKVTSYKIIGNKSHIVYEVQPNGSIEAKSGISFTGESTIIFTPGGETTATLTANLSADLSGTINWSLTDGTVSGTTSSNSVASITPLTGNTITVTKVGNSGETTITASLPGTSYTKTCTVKIVEAVASVTISPNALNLTIGSVETGTVSATAYGSSTNPTEATITYSSSNTNVATVNSSGVVTAVGEGQATITATATQGGTGVTSGNSCAVNVTEPVELLKDQNRGVVLSTGENKKFQDNQGNIIWIPANFKISTENANNGEAGNNVSEGIIIEDESGNQFVWVPVGNGIKVSSTQTVDIPLGRYGFNTTTGEASAVTGSYTDSTAAVSEFVTKTNATKGYYIARYEAGVRGTTGSNTGATYTVTNPDLTSETLTKNSASTGYIVSQAGKGVWNKITRANALTVCQGMYSSSLYKSALVNSYAWDTAIVFIRNCGTNTNYANAYDGAGGPLASGAKNDEQCHINDMARNLREWTTESSGSRCVNRGGRYNDTYYYTARRNSDNDEAYGYVGFRPLIYLNN